MDKDKPENNLIADASAVLATTPERWQRLVHSLPEHLLQRQPKPGEWSARECLAHLVDTEAIFTFRTQCFLGGVDFPAFNPDSQGSDPARLSAKELAEQFSSLRAHSLKSLASLVDGDLDRHARHAELGPVTLRQMLSEWAAHDLMHTVQAEQALMQPFIDTSGPWQVYFMDHWVKKSG